MSRIRSIVQNMENQRIGEVSRLGLGDPNVIALWFGESDQVTPAFIRQAAIRALEDGKTFYVNKRGIPELRDAVQGYLQRVYGIEPELERITVTGSGMTAIMIAVETLVDNGDNVVAISPVWPNIYYAVETMGGEFRHVRLEQTERGWQLDLNRLFDACDERTRAFFISSPGNPTP